MKFTEAHLGSAIIKLLGAKCYPHVLGEAIECLTQEILAKAALREPIRFTLISGVLWADFSRAASDPRR